ncbi:hypothetical protein ACWCPI_13625 [Streptomyces sp. NPDC001920]
MAHDAVDCPYQRVVRAAAWSVSGVSGLASAGSVGVMVWEMAQQDGPMVAGCAAAATVFGGVCGGLVKWLKKDKGRES